MHLRMQSSGNDYRKVCSIRQSTDAQKLEYSLIAVVDLIN